MASGDSTGTSGGSGTGTGTSGGAGGNTTPQAGMQIIGNNQVGYLQVPSSWVDRSSDYDGSLIIDTGMEYYVDPDSEYTSSALGHFNFSRAIQLRAYDMAYDDVAQQVIASYDDDLFGDVEYETDSMSGQKCYIVTSSIPEDGLVLVNIVLDRNGSGNSTILFTLQGTPNSIGTVMGYVSSWTLTR